MSSQRSRLASSKHHLRVSDEPPPQLSASQFIAKIATTRGNSLYTVELQSKSELLVELPTRYRNAIWVRRGGFVLVETEGYNNGKVNGEIIHVIQDEKSWRKMSYWCRPLMSLLNAGLTNLNGKRNLTKTNHKRKLVEGTNTSSL